MHRHHTSSHANTHTQNACEVCAMRGFTHRHVSLAWECRDCEKQRKRRGENRLEERGGWVHPGAILSCPRNFPTNTRKSLSDQQPNSSSAFFAEAPHASSRRSPNAAFHNHVDASAGLVYSQMIRATVGQHYTGCRTVLQWHLHVIYFISTYTSCTSAPIAPS